MDPKNIRTASLAFAIPMTMAACMLVTCAGGYLLDKYWLRTGNPLVMLISVGLGLAAGVRETMKLVRKIDDSDKE